MKFKTKVVGVTMENRQELIARHVQEGTEMLLVREPTNQYDKNAIKVVVKDNNIQIGYLSRDVAEKFAPMLDKGRKVNSVICMVVTGGGDLSYGVNIEIDIEAKVKQSELNRLKRVRPLFSTIGDIYADYENHLFYDSKGNLLVSGSVYAKDKSNEAAMDIIAKKKADVLSIEPIKIRELWRNDLSRNYGTLIHKAIELLIDNRKYLELMKPDDWIGALPMPVHVEKVMRSLFEKLDEYAKDSVAVSEALVASEGKVGTIDLLTTEVIIDFKTAKTKLNKQKLETYSKQLNWYRTIVADNHRTAEKMLLFVLVDDEWEVIEVEKKEVEL